MRFGWAGLTLLAGALLGGTVQAGQTPPRGPRADPAKPLPATDNPFQISGWASLDPVGGHLIRPTPVGKALASTPQENWEEITVFGHRRSAASIAADEKFHAGDPAYQASTSELADPSVKMAPAPTLFDFKF
jgi:hypothetical protein